MNKAKLTEYLNEVVEASDGKELLVKIFKDYKEIYSFEGGFRDAAKTEPSDIDDMFYIYSLTKPITCAAAMQLVERGLLDLNAPVKKYLPYFKDVTVKEGEKIVTPKNDVLVWQLFNMSAGFNYDTNAAYNEAVSAGLSTGELFKETALRVPLSFHPGEHWQYACRNHEAIACLIEEITGIPFYDYLNENIFTPLGMKHLRFTLDDYADRHLSDRFNFDTENDCFITVPKQFCLGPTDKYQSGGYGLICDINDYEKFANAMANLGIGANGNRILSEESCNLMRRDLLTDQNRKDYRLSGYDYGYGLGVRTLISHDAGSKSPIGEYGWDGAAGSYALFDPENRIAAVLFAHTLAGNKKLDHLKFRNLIYED
ncbi:MAG: beta-lactamase family protein [Clostridia bacterium]|nr:beta-lactamase family protein [Clostridia bacterium]